MPKCDFNKVAKHIFKTPFPKNTTTGLFLKRAYIPFPRNL